MEHANKMFLIDSRFDLRNESYRNSVLDRAISLILNSDLLEREKQLQYNQALQRYRINLANLESAVNKRVKVQTTTEEKKSVKDKIVETVAIQEKAKALQVYGKLSAYTPLTVDERGWLKQDGTVIENSNLVNLIVHDVKRKKKDKNCHLLGKYFLLQRSKRVLRKASY